MVGVLALQGDVREHVRMLELAGADAVPVRRREELAAVDGLVVPGGESTTIGRLLAVFDLLEPLRAAVRDGLPTYGSCAGMVLLADRVVDGKEGQPLVGGLDVTVRRNAFGRQVDSAERPVQVTGLGDLHGVFIRAPWVEETGPAVEVLATVDAGTGAEPAGDRGGGGRVVAVRQGHLLATSFHPELTGDPRVHALFVDMVRQKVGQTVGQEAGQTVREAQP